MTDKKLTELRKKAGETVDRPKDVEKKKKTGAFLDQLRTEK